MEHLQIKHVIYYVCFYLVCVLIASMYYLTCSSMRISLTVLVDNSYGLLIRIVYKIPTDR